MDLGKPKFADSEWIVKKPGSWYLKPGAPDEIVKEYAQFMADLERDDDQIELIDIVLDDDDE